MSWIVGVDVGGTFTDFFAVETQKAAGSVSRSGPRPATTPGGR